MAPRIVVIWILILQALWLGVYHGASKLFTPADQSRTRIEALQRQVQHQAFLMAQMEIKFGEYKDSVARAGLRIDENTKWTDVHREVASVFADSKYKIQPQSQVWINREFEKGRNYFLAGRYEEASDALEKFINEAADNSNLPKASYLLEESYVYLKQDESALKAIDFLISQFPETEYAGYAMVRLGKIFNEQSRPEEAAEMFNLVMNEYPKSNAAALAQKSLKDLPL